MVDNCTYLSHGKSTKLLKNIQLYSWGDDLAVKVLVPQAREPKLRSLESILMVLTSYP